MSEADSQGPAGFTERIGLRYFRRLETRIRPGDDTAIVIDEEVIAELNRVERQGIIWASVYGAASGILCALGTVWLGHVFEARPHHPLASYQWLLSIGISVVVTLIELLGLYRLSLVTAFRLAVASGADRWPDPAQREDFYLSLIRSGLELPNPNTAVMGIDPLRDASRWRLVVSALLYKLKRSVTNLVAKAIARRVVGRSAIRGLADFVAAPVFAIWNAVVFRWALREARLRAMSARYVDRLVARTLPDELILSPEAEGACLSAVAVAAVSAQDLHPNRVHLLRTLLARFSVGTTELTDEREAFLSRLQGLDAASRRAAVALLVGGVIIDGRISRRDRRLLTSAFAVIGQPLDLDPIRALGRRMRAEGWMTDAKIDAVLSTCFPAHADAEVDP